MSITIFTATGCTRCKIVKSFMDVQNITYEEKDMKAEGKEEFQTFYKTNRSAIFRGPDGIEFPIITDGVEIRQGIGATIAYLHFGEKLEGFFSVGTLHKEWVDGIHVSSGNSEFAEDFIKVLQYLKDNNMKLQVDTNGKNSEILQEMLDKGLADVVIMNVLGPEEIYGKILGEEIDIEEIKKSISITSQFPKYQFQTTVTPVIRGDENISYLTPEEVADTAKLIEEVTESKKHPYLIKMFDPKEAKDSRLKAIEPPSNLFTYRTKARANQVFADIEKN